MKKSNSNLKINAKKTWKYIKKSRKNLLGYFFASIFEAIISAILPLISAKIILNMTNGLIEELLVSAVVVFILDMILFTMYFLKGFFYQKIYQKTLISLQISLASEILNLEIKEMDNNSSGLFIDRLNKDTQDLSGLFMEYTYWISYIITNLGVLVAIFILNKIMFIYALITSIIIYLINRKGLNKQYEGQKELKKLQESKTGLTSELVRGIRDIKVLNANNTILNQTSNKIIETTNKQVKIMNIRRLYGYVENELRGASDLLFIIIGIFLFKNNLLTIATFVIIYNYQPKIKNLLVGVSNIVEYNKKFDVAAGRVYELIDGNIFKKENFGSKEVKKIEGNIKFKNVTFGYSDDNKILKKMNFEIKPNEKVAFVGKSGVGKTTIFSLITKLYHPQSGEILLDDNNINDLTCSSIRDNMSIITQNPYIFNFSIKENLLLANEKASMKEIREACKLACIDEYIMSLPEKYDTMVGENGIILSGGQKQRLAIARALLMKTEIILFDEATSALDNETQSEIQRAIDNLKGEYTILIVAHRLSTVIDCDKIFVVDNGKIVDSGTHGELLEKCIEYKNLYEKDLKK